MGNSNELELTFKVPASLKSLLPVVLPYMLGQEVQATVGAVTDILTVHGVDQLHDGTVALTLVPTTARNKL